MRVTIEEMTADDWPAVRAIYQEGIDTGNATFETEVPDWEEWDRAHMQGCRLVARQGEQVVAWAALSPVSARPVYRGVAEVTIYVARRARGRGIGKRLLPELIRRSEEAGFWTLQAAIFPENTASVALHTSCGFEVVGLRKRLGKLHGVWRDILLMERRSPVVGV